MLKLNMKENELSFEPSKEDLIMLNKQSKFFVSLLKNSLKKNKVPADVFIGGSFAKGTILKKEVYDIDIYVRFSKDDESISAFLEVILQEICLENKFEMNRIHGSRDYFQIKRGSNLVLEIIPVKKIKNQKEAENVTDLSYFHVNYVKKKINKKLAEEIRKTKAFCVARGVYGAESYVQGLSGYAIECLIIYYKGFEKFLKGIVNLKDQIIIDPAKYYKKKLSVMQSVNESRLKSKIILIDPTWKERNVLAALSDKSFDKLHKYARKYLINPSKKYFVKEKLDINKLRMDADKKKCELLEIELISDRQIGDIAGAKLLKVSNYLIENVSKKFDVKTSEFEYGGGKVGNLYLIVKPKNDLIINGPPVKMEKHAKAFKKIHRNAFVKKGKLYSKDKSEKSAERYLKDFIGKYDKQINGMGVSDICVD